MKRIEVRDQVSLPIRRCFKLCVRGIRYRLFRSAITVAIVTLAVAFLMMMISTSYVDRYVADDVRARTAGRRLLAEWVGKLSSPLTSQLLARRLAAAQPDSSATREMIGWGGLSAEELLTLSQVARRQQGYERFLDQIDARERDVLVGMREGDDIFEYLAVTEKLVAFVDNARTIHTGQMPGDKEGLENFIQEWTLNKPLRQKILVGHRKAVTRLAVDLKSQLDTENVLELFLRDKDDALALLARHGFYLAGEDFAVLQAEAAVKSDAQVLSSLLSHGRMRGVIAHKAKTVTQKIVAEHLFKIVSGKRGARWLRDEVDKARTKAKKEVEQARNQQALLVAISSLDETELAALVANGDERVAQLAEITSIRQATSRSHDDVRNEADVKPENVFELAAAEGGTAWLKTEIDKAKAKLPGEIERLSGRVIEPLTLSVERIVEVADTSLAQEHLAEVEADLPEVEVSRWLGFSGRIGWLIIISFVVCVVGVTNAMLMSVTERFREIATMKCLGALDSFIMISFVLESSLQGLAGGLMGVCIGLLLGVVRSCWSFGLLALGNLPGMILLMSAGVCLVAGIVLAALAALYPAWKAARLAPMEAMRIE